MVGAHGGLTVGELIAELQKWPADTLVYVDNDAQVIPALQVHELRPGESVIIE
jgi:hypothetical protein